MAADPDLTEAYKAVRDLAAELQRRGVDEGEIIDVLLVAGINGGIMATSREYMVDHLEKLAGQLRGDFQAGKPH